VPTQTKPENICWRWTKDGDIYWNTRKMPDIESAGGRAEEGHRSRSRSPRCTSAVTRAALRVVGRLVVACQRAGIAKVASSPSRRR
jgi:biopolymer transport protein ExbD